MFDPEETTVEWYHNPTLIVVMADLVTQGATRVKAACAMGLDRINVMTTEEYLTKSATHGSDSA
jgi:hypothetical protein